MQVMPIHAHFEGVYQGMPEACSDNYVCNDAYKRVYVQYKMNKESPGTILRRLRERLLEICFH
jgi:hypothetical protein